MHDARPSSWKIFAGLVTIVLGGLGFIASAAIGGGPNLEGAILAGALNPLFFIGAPLGFYWLLTANPRAIEAESQLAVKHASKLTAAVPPVAAKIPSEIEFRAAPNSGAGAVSLMAIVIGCLIVGGVIGYKLGLESRTPSMTSTPKPTTSTAEKPADDEIPFVQIRSVEPNDERNVLAQPPASVAGVHYPVRGNQQFRLSFTQPYVGRIRWNTSMELKGQVQIKLDGTPRHVETGAFAMLGTTLREPDLMRVLNQRGDMLACAIDRSPLEIGRLDGSLATFVENPQFNLRSNQEEHDLRALHLTFPSADCGELIKTSPEWKVEFPRPIKTYVGDVLLIYRCEDWRHPRTSCVAAVRVSDVSSDATHLSVEPAKIKRDWNSQPLQVGDYALYLGQPL